MSTKTESKKAERLGKKLFLAIHDIASNEAEIAAEAFRIASSRCEEINLTASSKALEDIAKIYDNTIDYDEEGVQVTVRTGKPRIAQNAWGNWYGYIGTKRVEAFSNSIPNYGAEQAASRWLKIKLMEWEGKND